MANVLLFLHVVSGFTALTTGTLAAFLRKRRGLHSLMGSIFSYSMYVVVLTGIPLSIIGNNLFLLAISIFTAYMVITGSRAFRGIHKPQRKLLSVIGFLGGLGLISIMVYVVFTNFHTLVIVPAVFGSLLLSMSISEWKISNGKKHNPLTMHLNRMGGSLIAAYTAFLTAGAAPMFAKIGLDLSQLGIVLWLLPTVVGSIILTRVNIRLERA